MIKKADGNDIPPPSAKQKNDYLALCTSKIIYINKRFSVFN